MLVHNPDISLRNLLGATLPITTSRGTTARLYGQPAPLFVDVEPFLNAVMSNKLANTISAAPAAVLGQSAADAPGPVLRHLARAALDRAPVKYNHQFRERVGGRTYCLYTPNEAFHSGPRVHLQSIPRAVREAVRAGDGELIVSVDVNYCFLAIGAALSRDSTLRADLNSDIHAAAGASLFPTSPPSDRRTRGKLINNSLVGGTTHIGLQRAFVKAGVPLTLSEAQRVHAGWWGRYPRFMALRGAVVDQYRRAKARGHALYIEAPEGRVFGLVGAEESLPAEIAHQERSAFSSLFRAVEGAVLDRALALVGEHRVAVGIRLALPMYDGAVFSVPRERADAGQHVVQEAFALALAEAGVEAGIEVAVRSTWGK